MYRKRYVTRALSYVHFTIGVHQKYSFYRPLPSFFSFFVMTKSVVESTLVENANYAMYFSIGRHITALWVVRLIFARSGSCIGGPSLFRGFFPSDLLHFCASSREKPWFLRSRRVFVPFRRKHALLRSRFVLRSLAILRHIAFRIYLRQLAWFRE